MKLKLFLLVLLTTISILLFDSIELFLLNKVGLSWTFSKIFPYALLIVFGLLFFLQIIKMKGQKIIKVSIGMVALVLPFGIGFQLHKIYEGDFSKLGTSIVKNSSPLDFKSNGLMVITIPDCPFCYGSIQKLKMIKRRQPKLNISFVVCARDKKYIETYKKEINGEFTIRIAKNADSLAAVANFRFPAFVLVENNKPKYMWSNDQFGVRAIDEMEKSIK